MADASKIKLKVKKEVLAEGKDNKELLYNFLSEFIYIKDVDGILFKKFEVKIFKGSKGKNKAKNKKNLMALSLLAKCAGDTLEGIGRQNLLNDVKAITMHMFEIKKEKGKWAATVVVDI